MNNAARSVYQRVQSAATVVRWHTFDERVDAAAEVLCREDGQFTVPWKDVPQVHKENYLDLARRALRAAGVV